MYMTNKSEMIVGTIGTITTGVGASISVNEVLQIIATCLTIAGGIMTLIILPLLNWWRNAKQDGKITKEEIQEGIEIVQNGVEELKDKNGKEK